MALDFSFKKAPPPSSNKQAPPLQETSIDELFSTQVGFLTSPGVVQKLCITKKGATDVLDVLEHLTSYQAPLELHGREIVEAPDALVRILSAKGALIGLVDAGLEESINTLIEKLPNNAKAQLQYVLLTEAYETPLRRQQKDAIAQTPSINNQSPSL